MRWKTTLILVIVATLLTLLNWADAARDEAALANRARQGLLVPFPTDDIRRFRLVSKTGEVTLSRTEKTDWQVTAPYEDLVSEDVLEALKSLCAYARQAPAVESENTFTTPEATLDITSMDTTITLEFGPLAKDPTQRLVRVMDPLEGSSQHTISADLTTFTQRPIASFRKMTLLGDVAEHTTEIVLSGTQAGTLRLVREGTGWMLLTPVPWPAHVVRVEQFLRLCAETRASDVVALRVPNRTDFGFMTDGPGITLITAKGEAHTILLAPTLDEDQNSALALVEGRSPVFRISDKLLEEVTSKSANDWRKHMLDVLEGTGELSRILLTGPKGTTRLEYRSQAWTGTAPEAFTLDQQAILELTKSIGALTVRQFIADKPDDTLYGFNAPYASMTLTGSDGAEKVRLTIGKKVDDDGHEFYARLADRPQVFTLSDRGILFILQPWFVWRDRTISRFEWRHPRKLSIIEGNTKTIYRRNQGDMWQLVSPRTAMADTFRLYTGVFGEDGLGRLNALAWISEKRDNLADFGLDQPSLRVVVEFDSVDGTILPALDLEIGNATTMGKTKAYFARQRLGAGKAGPVFLIAENVVQIVRIDYTDASYMKDITGDAPASATPPTTDD